MNNILIIGLGLIGGSYARILTSKGYKVSAIDTDQSSITYALENNIISNGSTVADENLISNADLVIFGVYPKIMIKWITENQKFFKKGAVITDVSGVKCGIVDAIEAILRDDVFFVSSHPMAGREVSGVENSSLDMFKSANFIITPTENSNEDAIKIVEKLASELEFLTISSLTPEKHDEAIGFLSQLTHAIAVSLMNCKHDDNFVKYTGDSFRDLTRIAMINEHLWSELFLCNKDGLVADIDCFIDELSRLKQTLIDEDEKTLKDLFIKSTNRRVKYLKKSN
ncbi:MAG: prephenate dehydrogenase [Clostridia bacterium]